MVSIFAFIAVAQTAAAFSDIPADYFSAKGKPTSVMAKVNGVSITQADVEKLVWDWQSQAILNELIDYQIIRNEAKRQSVTVSVQEIRAAVQNAIKQYSESLPPGTNVEKELKKQGFTRSRVYLSWQARLLTDRLLLRKFDPKEFIKVSTIVIAIPSKQATDVEAAGKKATQAYNDLISGKQWNDVLSANVTDPNVVSSGGAIGWRLMSAFPAEVQNEFKVLKVGGITKPVQTNYGFQIFRIDALGKEAPQAELNLLKADYVRSSQPGFVEELRKKAKVERF